MTGHPQPLCVTRPPEAPARAPAAPDWLARVGDPHLAEDGFLSYLCATIGGMVGLQWRRVRSARAPGVAVGSPGAIVRSSVAPSRTRRVDRAVSAAIRGYRRVSPRLPTRCRYVPTCSAYGLEAVSRYGAFAGLRLTAARLARCRPGVPYGTVDPVP